MFQVKTELMYGFSHQVQKVKVTVIACKADGEDVVLGASAYLTVLADDIARFQVNLGYLVVGVKRVDPIAVHVRAVDIGQEILIISIHIDGFFNLEVIVDGEGLVRLFMDVNYDV